MCKRCTVQFCFSKQQLLNFQTNVQNNARKGHFVPLVRQMHLRVEVRRSTVLMVNPKYQ